MSDPQKKSSGSILLVTIVVSIVLIVLIWPLSQLGKGGARNDGSADDADVRIQPVARVEMQKAPVAAAASGKPRDGAVQVIGALDKYAAYFDDPGFLPIAH